MKKIILAGVTVLSLGIMAMAPAQARDGCGPYKHRNWDGYCVWNRPAPPPRPVFFGFYGFGHPHPGWGWHHHWRRW
jgi:hypothetical protein